MNTDFEKFKEQRELDKMDVLIKEQLCVFPYKIDKDKLMTTVNERRSKAVMFSKLYNHRRFAYAAAIMLVVIISSFSILFYKHQSEIAAQNKIKAEQARIEKQKESAVIALVAKNFSGMPHFDLPLTPGKTKGFVYAMEKNQGYKAPAELEVKVDKDKDGNYLVTVKDYYDSKYYFDLTYGAYPTEKNQNVDDFLDKLNLNKSIYQDCYVYKVVNGTSEQIKCTSVFPLSNKPQTEDERIAADIFKAKLFTCDRFLKFTNSPGITKFTYQLQDHFSTKITSVPVNLETKVDKDAQGNYEVIFTKHYDGGYKLFWTYKVAGDEVSFVEHGGDVAMERWLP